MDLSRYSAVGRTALSLSALVVLLGACYWTFKLGWASALSGDGSAESLIKAISLAPGDSKLLTQYAGVVASDEATRAQQRAVALNPGDSSTWIQLGLSAEAKADFALAERCYRKAAIASRKFQPSWTLANYFFRRGNDEQFRIWAAKALGMAYGNAAPLFQLCWRATSDPQTVIGAIRDRRDLQRQYLAFLVSEGRLDAADKAARALLSRVQQEDLPELLTYASVLVETGAARPAMEIWNELCRQKAIPYRVLEPEHGASLTNGGFDVAPSSRGFDWRILPWTGVSVLHFPQPGCLRVTFSGEQPESCEILTQLVPVIPGKTYTLRYEHHTSESDKETGVRWRVLEPATDRELTQDSPQLSSEQWGYQTLHFSTSPTTRLVRLALVYQRTPGTNRMEGSLWLRKITLE